MESVERELGRIFCLHGGCKSVCRLQLLDRCLGGLQAVRQPGTDAGVCHWSEHDADQISGQGRKQIMFYAIVGQDVPDSLDRRLAARPAHVERLQALQQAGRLLLAGPFPAIDSSDPGAAGFTGSLIVAEFETLADAQAWAETDPYVAAGVYAGVSVKPFRKTFPS